MNMEKHIRVFSVLCAALLVPASVFAQDDLDNLLGELEATPTAPAKPAAQPAPEAQPAEPAPAPAPEAKPEEPAPAPAPEAKPAEPTPEEPAPAPAPAPEAQPEEPAPAPAPEAKPAEPAPEEPAPAPAPEAQPVEPAPAPVAAPAPKAKPAAPVHPDAELIADIMATETLRRESLDRQAERELLDARAAMAEQDWDRAYAQYRLALAHLNDREESRPLRRECAEGMAEAQYQGAKRAMRNGDRETARKMAEEALKLRHPRAAQLRDVLVGEREQDAEKDTSEIKHRRNDPDYKESRDLIRRRLRRSAQYLTVADIDNALDQCDLVLRTDPYNSEALALRERIQRRRDQILQHERAATRKGMIAEVSRAWRPVYAVNSPELKGVDGGTVQTPVGGDPERSLEQSIEKRMKEMILPAIAFRPPATIIDAVDYFRQASKDFDRPEIPIDQRGFNLVLDIGKVLTGGAAAKPASDDSNDFSANADENGGGGAAGDVPQIPNISASNISLWDALKLVCKVTGFKFKVQGPVVMVMPKDVTTDELITRSYTVTENFAERMSGASSDMKEMKSGFSSGNNNNDDEAENTDQTLAWKRIFTEMGVQWPKGSQISYIKSLGKLRVTNTADQLAVFEQALNEMNVTPTMIEIETRFVEVAQEDLNSLGFEWLLNSDYSFNVGGKLGKVLGLKDITQQTVTTDGTKSQVLVPTSDSSYAYIDKVTDGTTSQVWRKWNGSGYGKTDTDTGLTVPTGAYIDKTTSQWVSGVPDSTWANQVDKTFFAASKNLDPEGKTVTSYTKVNSYDRTRTGRNLGLNAVNGTDYSSGMRYISQTGNHISGEGKSNNDQFFKLNAFLGNADVSMILHMLAQRSDTDLLSAPKVVTKSGQEAVIKVVTEYIYPQDYDVTIQSSSGGSDNNGSTYSRGSAKILPMVEPQNFTMREVGVILDVTPEVSQEGQMINLELKPQIISDPTWKDYGMRIPMEAVRGENTIPLPVTDDEDKWFNVPMEQPFFKVRSIETHVSLYNGATLVMGGLITEQRKSMEDKIPFLGDIPWVGRFFRSRSEWSDKRNLLLFVTARLVDPNGRQMVLGSGDDSATPKPATEAAPKSAAPTPEKK